MKIRIEIDEKALRVLVANEIKTRTGIDLDPKLIAIETKSRQNFKAEWESGAGFRAIFDGEVAGT